MKIRSFKDLSGGTKFLIAKLVDELRHEIPEEGDDEGDDAYVFVKLDKTIKVSEETGGSEYNVMLLETGELGYVDGNDKIYTLGT